MNRSNVKTRSASKRKYKKKMPEYIDLTEDSFTENAVPVNVEPYVVCDSESDSEIDTAQLPTTSQADQRTYILQRYLDSVQPFVKKCRIDYNKSTVRYESLMIKTPLMNGPKFNDLTVEEVVKLLADNARASSVDASSVDRQFNSYVDSLVDIDVDKLTRSIRDRDELLIRNSRQADPNDGSSCVVEDSGLCFENVQYQPETPTKKLIAKTPNADKVCPICLELLKDREVMATFCGHIFCAACIKACISRKKQCPSCRAGLNLKKIHPLFL